MHKVNEYKRNTLLAYSGVLKTTQDVQKLKKAISESAVNRKKIR